MSYRDIARRKHSLLKGGISMNRYLMLKVWLLALFIAVPVSAQEARYGAGVFFNRSVPMLGFHDRYSASQVYGAVLDYQISSRATMEFEYHHMTMDDGKIENLAFTWPIDKQKYLSPDANSRFNLNSFLINALAYLNPRKSSSDLQLLPYIAVGAGFYDYQDRITGLIYPGQKEQPLKSDLMLEDQDDEHTALGANLGLGMTVVQNRFGLDIRGRYHIILGDLRPMESWDLPGVFPLAMFDFRTAFKLYW